MKTVHLTAHGIKVDTDEGRFCLVIETQYGEDDEMLLQVDIHDEVLEFYAAVQREIRPYALEADSARAAVNAGMSREEYEVWSTPGMITNRPVSVEDAVDAGVPLHTFIKNAEDALAIEDTGYALDDPKHPTYHDRMVD